MRLSLKAVVLGLAATTTASSWFPGTKLAYNKWHETELERFLSDHDIPYPTAADRKDFENLVKENWQSKVVDTFSGVDSKVSDHYGGVKDWIFDSWTDSTLKSFLDHNKITSPQPRTRDKLLTSARQNYDAIAKKTEELTSYPGNWLYQSWSESDLKEFLDSRGIPAPQPSSRDKLIASVRRNARLASLQSSSAMKEAQKSASSASAAMSKSAASAQASLSNYVYESWSDSKLKAFLDEHGVPVPQGSKKNELIALARKNAAKLAGNSASSVSASASSALSGASASGSSALSGASASGASALSGASASGASAFGAATSSAGNIVAKATDAAVNAAHALFDGATDTWSDSRLKAYLDSRGVPVPQGSKRDELLASVRLNKHKASTGWSAWTFDTWTVENLQKYLESTGQKFKKGAVQNRDELAKQAQDQYASASKVGGTKLASATEYLSKQTDVAKESMFDSWSDSDLKSYLDSYGLTTYQGSTTNELKAEARKQYNYFKYGTSSPSGTFFAKIQENVKWLVGKVAPFASSASSTVSASGSSAISAASKSASSASVLASKSASSAASVASKSASSAASAASVNTAGISASAASLASAASASLKSAASQASASVNSFKSEL